MGKHFWIRHVNDELEGKQPGCVWGLVHALDYHHWHSNVRKMIHHRKHEGQRQSKLYAADGSPKTKLIEFGEVEKLLNDNESPFIRTKNSRFTNKQPLKARIKTLIAEEISKEGDNKQQKAGLSVQSRLQRTYSIHHLESADGGLNKICSDWEQPITFLPSSVDNGATELVDTANNAASDQKELNSEESNICSANDGTKHELEEGADVLDMLKVDKELFVETIKGSDKSIGSLSNSLVALNKAAKLSKSKSFPAAELLQRRKFKPSKLEHKQNEIWSFGEGNKLLAVNKAPNLDRSENLVRRSSRMSADGRDIVLDQDLDSTSQNVITNQDIEGTNEVPSEVATDLDEFSHKSVPPESVKDISQRWNETKKNRSGEEYFLSASDTDESNIRKVMRTHRRSSSLNDSLDKYASLFANSYGTDIKLNPSKSLKLINDYGYAPIYFGRIRSLSHVDYHYSNQILGVPGNDFSSNDSIKNGEESISGITCNSREEEQLAGQSGSTGENTPLVATDATKGKAESAGRYNHVQRTEDDASFRVNAGNEDKSVLEGCADEADELTVDDSDLHREQVSNCSDIIPEKLSGQLNVEKSETSFQEIVSHDEDLQFFEGLDHGCNHFDEKNSSIGSHDLKSLHLEFASSYNMKDLEKIENAEENIRYFRNDESQEKNDSDLYYVRHILEQSGIIEDDFDIKWHLSDQPLSLQLFEEVESCWTHEKAELTGWPDFYGCWHHRLLFDLVNELLLQLYDRSFPYYPKALSCSCRVPPMPAGKQFIDELSAKSRALLNLKCEQDDTLDSIIANDLANDYGWMNLQLETESVALELEEMIFDELLEEVLHS